MCSIKGADILKRSSNCYCLRFSDNLLIPCAGMRSHDVGVDEVSEKLASFRPVHQSK